MFQPLKVPCETRDPPSSHCWGILLQVSTSLPNFRLSSCCVCVTGSQLFMKVSHKSPCTFLFRRGFPWSAVLRLLSSLGLTPLWTTVMVSLQRPGMGRVRGSASLVQSSIPTVCCQEGSVLVSFCG